MEYRNLGRSGLRVSPICLGTMMFGGATGERAAGRIVGRARDAGVNFIDTADAYSKGACERVVGKLIRRDRERWVLATKVGNPMGPDPHQRGLGRKWISRAIDASLKRLGSDYVDLYYLHLDDPETPLEETIATLGDLIRAGKVLHWGFSNFWGWRIPEMVRLAEGLGVPWPVVAQPYYNALNRMPEVEYLPACSHFDVGVVPYAALARGVLTGKYPPGAAPTKGSRAGRKDRRILETEFRKESLVIAQKVKARAESRGMTAGQYAFNWVLNNRLVTSVLAGPRTERQWAEFLGAFEHPFPAGDEAFMDKLVPPGHPSTPGYSDPKYPVTGRVART